MSCKLSVALVATRWQWEAMVLGYGPWPPDGAGIQQITPWLFWDLCKRAEGLLEMASPSLHPTEEGKETKEGVDGSVTQQWGLESTFPQSQPRGLWSLPSNDVLIFSLDLHWRPKVSWLLVHRSTKFLKAWKMSRNIICLSVCVA